MKKYIISLLLGKISAYWEEHLMMKICFSNKGKNRIKIMIYCSIQLFLDNQDLTIPIYQLSHYAVYHHVYPKHGTRQGINLCSCFHFNSSSHSSLDVSVNLSLVIFQEQESFEICDSKTLKLQYHLPEKSHTPEYF